MRLIEVEFTPVLPDCTHCDVGVPGRTDQTYRIPMTELPPGLQTAILRTEVNGKKMRALVNVGARNKKMCFVDWEFPAKQGLTADSTEVH